MNIVYILQGKDHHVYLPLDASAAITSGIIGTKKPPVTVACVTGNCIWPVIPTLGVCSSCNDIKSQINITTPAPKNSSSSVAGPVYTIFLGDEYTSSLSNNVSVNLGDPDDVFAIETVIPGGYLPTTFPSGRLTFARVFALGVPASSFQNLSTISYSSSSLNSLVVAYSCDLYFCLQAYDANTTSGNYTEEMIESWDQMNASVPADFSSSNWAPGRPQPVWGFSAIPESMNVMNATEYRVDYQSRGVLGYSVASSVFGTVGYDGLGGVPEFFDSRQGTSTTDATIIQSIWLSSNSTSTMSSRLEVLADTYTAYMRSEIRAPPNGYYAPSMSSQEIFVRVRWPWLAYPLALVLAAYIFFIATLLQTRQRVVRPWKSQRLPLLLANIDDTVCEFASGGLHRHHGLEDRVGRMKVQMQFDGQDGVYFKRVAQEIRQIESNTQLLRDMTQGTN